MTIDHVAEGSDGDKALGSQHKRASIRGASLFVERVKPFGRGRYGVARLSVAKDRRGWVRGTADRISGDRDVAGMFVFDASHVEGVEPVRPPQLSFVRVTDWNTDQTGNLGRLSEQVATHEDQQVAHLVEVLRGNDGANTTELTRLTGWTNKQDVARVAAAAERLGLIEVRRNGLGRPTTHHLAAGSDA